MTGPHLNRSPSSEILESKDGLSSPPSSTPSTYDEKILPDIPSLADREATAGGGFGRFILNLFTRSHRNKIYDLDAVATQPSVFDTSQAVHYAPSETYENHEYFDTLFRWSWREERTVTRKIDFKVFAWMALMFLSLNINRYNMTNATADNFLKDLGLTQSDYNIGNTIYRASFLFAELPSQLISKRLGPDRWLPIQLSIASIIAASQFWLSGRASFFATRVLIALFQGGFIPDTILYLSYFYTKHELPVRLGFFWVMNYLSNVITGFLAVGILEMRGVAGHAGWRWMFLLEGLATLVIALASFFMMPPGPSQTKARWRKQGYFTDNEVKIVVNKILRDDPGKSSMHNREGLPLKKIVKSLADYDMYPLYLIGLLFGLGGYPISNYFQLSMRDLHFGTLMSNLLSIPHSVLSMVNLVVITIVSELIDIRALVAIVEDIWMLPCYVALVTLPDPISGWQYFSVATVLLGFPYVHAIQVAWTSRNSGNVENRTVSASLYNMAVQLSAIIGANLYQKSDAPRYPKANAAILAILAFNVAILYPGTRFYYKWRNAKRAAIWDHMPSEEKSVYLRTTSDEGNKRLDFRFAY